MDSRSGSRFGARLLAVALLAGALGFALGRFSAPEPAPERAQPTLVPASERAVDPAPEPPLSRDETQRAKPKPAPSEPREPIPRAEVPGARVQGFVVDENGKRVAGALLLLGEDAVFPLADARAVGHSDAAGAIALDERVAPPQRHIVAHLFAVTDDRIGWVQLAVPEGAEVVHVGDVRLTPATQIEALVVDDRRTPLAGVEVEARARFYPLSGIFDAIRDEENSTGFSPHASVQKLFRARTDANGLARFTHLPAPGSASRYELCASDARFGQGKIDADAGGGESLVIKLRPPR